MTNEPTPRKLSRRDLLGRGAALTFVAAGGAALMQRLGGPGIASAAYQAAGVPVPEPHLPAVHIRLAATDGHIHLPGRDPLYVFGFNPIDPVDMSMAQAIEENKGFVKNPAPIIGVDQYADLYLTVSNLGFTVRPDLADSHTVHWHGFPNQSAVFDGVPEVSIAVPPGRSFPYFFRPRREGTFMYHCHFEDTEHVQMGMDGIIYVRPAQNFGTESIEPGKYVYNDGDGSTAYDREFTLLFNELWSLAHDNLESIQENLWTNYKPDYWVINGRSYPDTVAMNDDAGLPEQPTSALMQVNPGERVLMRMVNLGYEQDPIELPGIEMKVVGEDATLLRGRGGTDLSYNARIIYIGPGEARDVLFTAPGYDGGKPGGEDGLGLYNRYLLRNRNYHTLTNGGASGLGGQVTEVRVYAPTLGGPRVPNHGQPNETYAAPEA
jgi:FtsP/CotA-like multicopper oxidase with cupredoxin domain